MPTTVRIPDDLRDRIDAERPATVSREAWVRAACIAALIADAANTDLVRLVADAERAASFVQGFGEMCRTCVQNDPPKSRPCSKCGHQR